MYSEIVERNVIVIFLAVCCMGPIACPASADDKDVLNQDLRSAANRAVQLVERTSKIFLEKRTCFTCHTQTLSVIVLKDARRVGFEIDETNFKRQYERAFEESMFGGVRVDTVGYALWALDIGQHAPNEKTEQFVGYLLNYEKELGIWKTTVDRPPAEASNFTTNYVALRGVNRYASEKQQEEVRARATAVKQWLKSAKATDTEDLVFGLRLSHELKMPLENSQQFVAKLLSEQRDDGGWAQKPEMQPDGYATGSVLVALHETGGLSCNHSSWQRGLAFLLRTQRPDGSWHVETRVTPIQEYFESGFPHGKDQFISAFATGWATESLLIALAQDYPQP